MLFFSFSIVSMLFRPLSPRDIYSSHRNRTAEIFLDERFLRLDFITFTESDSGRENGNEFSPVFSRQSLSCHKPRTVKMATAFRASFSFRHALILFWALTVMLAITNSNRKIPLMSKQKTSQNMAAVGGYREK